ncbi:MAG TPA: hypothetical protein VM010_05670, partial [Chitinophagaceae bacterium]|nr:hypothetical protein [Chitinophagaceae bacterium]
MSTRTFLIAFLLLFVFSASNAQTATSSKKTTTQSIGQNAAASFNGAWQSSMDNSKGFSVMHDGYFNSVGQDSAGKWDDVHAGTYTVNSDNTITFKILYSSWPDHVGAENTAEYTVSGETIKLRHFKKLVDPQG